MNTSHPSKWSTWSSRENRSAASFQCPCRACHSPTEQKDGRALHRRLGERHVAQEAVGVVKLFLADEERGLGHPGTRLGLHAQVGLLLLGVTARWRSSLSLRKSHVEVPRPITSATATIPPVANTTRFLRTSFLNW